MAYPYGFDLDQWMVENGPLTSDDDDVSHGNDEVSYLYSVPAVPQLRPADSRRVGYDPETFTFYEGPQKCQCCTNWVERMPTQMPAVAKEKYDRAAILLFKGKNHKSEKATVGGVVALEESFLEIQSETLARLIRPTLAKYGCLAPKNTNIKVHAPFKELFHSYPEISTLRDSHQHYTDEYTHLNALIGVMDQLFLDSSFEIRELHAKEMVSCEHLWTIYPKGIIVFCRRDGQDRLLQVEKIERFNFWRSQKIREWKIVCRYLQFDGVRFGWVQQTFRIAGFPGVEHISSLPVYPLGFHADKGLEQRIRAQGQMILAHQGISHCEYNGRGATRLQGCFDEDDDSDVDEDLRRLQSRPVESVNATGKVIVDVHAYKKYNPGRMPELKPMLSRSYDDDGNEIQNQSSIDPTGRNRYEAEAKGRLNSEEQAMNKKFINETPEYMLLLSPMLPCFSLKKNQWLWLCVDGLKTIKWSSAAFDSLVIPEKRKNLLLTFIRHHNWVNQVNADVVEDKGKGLVVMLSGPPGTGKTLTAEAVAERAQRPLFRLQAENMGTNPVYFSCTLAENLEMSTEWNAIVLLDEADAFLGRRSLEHPERNDMVSVMLRQLEYYRGIIMLTTNLVEHIDDAFRSRIHFHLCYPAHSQEVRQKIWKGFLKRIENLYEAANKSNRPASPSGMPRQKVGTYVVQPTDIETLAAWELNGREIKNVVKTVYLWCRYNALDFSVSCLEDGIELTAPFSVKRTSDGDLEPTRKRPRVE